MGYSRRLIAILISPASERSKYVLVRHSWLGRGYCFLCCNEVGFIFRRFEAPEIVDSDDRRDRFAAPGNHSSFVPNPGDTFARPLSRFADRHRVRTHRHVRLRLTS